MAQAQANSARKVRRRRIRVAPEVNPDDVALTRNHMAIDDAQHGNTCSLLHRRGGSASYFRSGYLPLIAMRFTFDCAGATFGSVTVSTPFLNAAEILVLVHVLDWNASFETAVVTLAEQPILVLYFRLLFASDRKDAIRQLDLDVLLVQAG